jgi:hypothetical protein
MKKFFGCISMILILILSCALFMSSGCSAPDQEGLAFYFTQDDLHPGQMPVLNQIEIQESAFITVDDITSYNAQTHELKLTVAAYDRLYRLDVPVRGKTFVVCVDRKPIYWGAFWTPISSISFDGVTIWKPFNPGGQPVVTLELGYPATSFYAGTDPRNDPTILKSLEKSRKLIDKLTLMSIDKLPGSMKGYELYSWTENSRWNFTLITGTNRNKTLEEIVHGDDFISESGWVKIHTESLDEVKTIFSKLPQNESIHWLSDPRSDQTPQNNIHFSLPGENDIEIIKGYAKQFNLDLVILQN